MHDPQIQDERLGDQVLKPEKAHSAPANPSRAIDSSQLLSAAEEQNIASRLRIKRKAAGKVKAGHAKPLAIRCVTAASGLYVLL